MNAQKQEQYDFTQASPSGQPGFEVFEDTKNNCWRFHGNDVEGRPTLFSQAYASADSGQRGLKTTLRLIKKKKSQIVEEDDGWQILVQSGNHQELARSRSFETKDAASKALHYFLNVANSPKAVIEQQQAPEPAGSAAQDREADTPVRHAFRLFFYPAKKDGGLNGRIENINNPDENTSFQGMDSKSIMEFLEAQIQPASPPPAKPKQQPATKVPKSSSREPVRKTTANTPVNTIAGSISPGPTSSAVVQRQKGSSTELSLKPTPKMPAEADWRIAKCELDMRQMETGVLHRSNGVYARLTEDGQIRLQVATDYLPTGTYYLNTSVWLQPNTDQSETSQYCVKGTGWLQLV